MQPPRRMNGWTSETGVFSVKLPIKSDICFIIVEFFAAVLLGLAIGVAAFAAVVVFVFGMVAFAVFIGLDVLEFAATGLFVEVGEFLVGCVVFCLLGTFGIWSLW